MIEIYPEIRWVHIAAVIASGSLFMARGALVMAGKQRAAMEPTVRWMSYTIDTVLLAAAVVLAVIVRQYPFVHPWLTAKVVLLVLYIALGTFALKRGRTPAVRWSCYLAALVVYLWIVGVALSRHPSGWLYPFGG